MCRVWSDRISSILICLVYKHPKIPFDATPVFLNNLHDLCSSYSHKVVMEDFNANLLVTNSNSHLIRNLVDELSLQVIKHDATNCPLFSIEPKT